MDPKSQTQMHMFRKRVLTSMTKTNMCKTWALKSQNRTCAGNGSNNIMASKEHTVHAENLNTAMDHFLNRYVKNIFNVKVVSSTT